MEYQPNDPEFYRFLKEGMPPETLDKWHRESLKGMRGKVNSTRQPRKPLTKPRVTWRKPE